LPARSMHRSLSLLLARSLSHTHFRPLS
jgi:hypothetical protein